jgi:hypothetical protein
MLLLVGFMLLTLLGGQLLEEGGAARLMRCLARLGGHGVPLLPLCLRGRGRPHAGFAVGRLPPLEARHGAFLIRIALGVCECGYRERGDGDEAEHGGRLPAEKIHPLRHDCLLESHTGLLWKPA